MPITTRSRASGIVKRVRVDDSVDLSESVSSYAPKKRTPKGRRATKELSIDSEFEPSGKDTVSDSRTVDDSSVSGGVQKEYDDSSKDEVASFLSRVKKPVRKSRFRSKLSGTAESPVLVEKLRLFPEALFETSLDSLRESIRGQISAHAETVAVIDELSKEFHLKVEKRSEIVNKLLFNMKNQDIVEVYRFANSSFIGISPVKIKEYWDQLTIIARELLAKSPATL